MSKEEDLETLDELVRSKMIKYLQRDETDMLSDLNTVVSYLAKNNVVAEKHKSSVEENIEKKKADAKARRAATIVEDL